VQAFLWDAANNQQIALVQGSLWDVAWSADSSYIAGITTKNVGEASSVDAAWQSMLYYWRRDGSLACTAEIDYVVSKVFVDPGNHAYVVTVGSAGKVWLRKCWWLSHRGFCTVACQTLNRLGHGWAGEPGNHRAISGISPTNDKPRWFNIWQSYGGL
jgi:hypothetical protein